MGGRITYHLGDQYMFTRSFSGGNKTLPMTVKNTGFLLDRLGQDCHPLQFLRELTRNAIEAIQRTEKPGQILWDVDWTTYDLAGVLKLWQYSAVRCHRRKQLYQSGK